MVSDLQWQGLSKSLPLQLLLVPLQGLPSISVQLGAHGWESEARMQGGGLGVGAQ